MEQTHNKHNKLIIFYILFFILFSIVMYLCPHTADDAYYDYLNLTDPYKILHFAAGYGNGRVLGNLLAVILCKSKLLAALVRSLTVSALIYFIVRLAGNKKNSSILTLSVSLLIIGINGLFFGEVFAWISAFSNYIPPMLLTLICLCIIKERPKENSLRGKILTIVELLIFGSSAQLFTENNTLNSIFLSTAVLIYCIAKHKSKIINALTYFIASCAGAFVMVYARKFIHDKDGIYTTVNYDSKLGSLNDIIINAKEIYGKFVCWLPKFFLLYIMISVILLVLINKSNKPLPKSFLNFSLCTYPAYCILSSVMKNGDFANQKMQYLYMAITTILFMLYIIALLVCGKLFNKETATIYIFTIIFSLFTSGYFIVLNPVNPRCIYYSYIIFIITFCIICNKAIPLININKKAIKRTVAFGIIGIFAFLIPLYANITVMNNQMNKYVDYQVQQGKKSVYVCLLTNTDYFHHSYASARLGYTYYNKKPNDVNFELISQGSWLKNCYKDGNYKTE